MGKHFKKVSRQISANLGHHAMNLIPSTHSSTTQSSAQNSAAHGTAVVELPTIRDHSKRDGDCGRTRSRARRGAHAKDKRKRARGERISLLRYQSESDSAHLMRNVCFFI